MNVYCEIESGIVIPVIRIGPSLDPNFLLIHVHIAYVIWALLATSEFTTASEVKSDPRFEISDLNYLHIHVHIANMIWTLLTASEATTASKQPRR